MSQPGENAPEAASPVGGPAEPITSLADIERRVEAALAKIRPAIQMDGGDVDFISFEDGVVRIAMSGACEGCALSALTLKAGIERLIKREVPEVKAVEAI